MWVSYTLAQRQVNRPAPVMSLESVQDLQRTLAPCQGLANPATVRWAPLVQMYCDQHAW